MIKINNITIQKLDKRKEIGQRKMEVVWIRKQENNVSVLYEYVDKYVNNDKYNEVNKSINGILSRYK